MTKEKGKKRRIRFSAIAVFLVIAFLLIKGAMKQPEIIQNQERIEALQGQVEMHEEKLDDLNELSKKVDTDEYIEKVAREQLGLVKENEIIFIDVAGE